MAQKLTLICYPYAGGASALFLGWRRYLTEISIEPVCLPGRGIHFDKRPARTMEELVNFLVGSAQFEPPYAFFGHSMGALVGFEVIRRLRSKGYPQPLYLFASACPAPQHFSIDPKIHNLRDDDFISRLRGLNGTPSEVLDHPELIDLLLPVLRADFEICETYEYIKGEPLRIPISVFGGEEDTEVPVDFLRAWCQQTTSDFNMQVYPGGHFFLHKEWPCLLEKMVVQLKTVEQKRTAKES